MGCCNCIIAITGVPILLTLRVGELHCRWLWDDYGSPTKQGNRNRSYGSITERESGMTGEMLANWGGEGGDASTFQGLPLGMDTLSLVDCGLIDFVVTGEAANSVTYCL